MNSLLMIDDVITKGPWVDVRAFGTKADGVTDDRAAIQNALNRGGTIRFTAGTYNVGYQIPASYPICLDVQDNTHIIIDKNVTIKCAANDYTHYYIFNIDGKKNVTIEDGTIIGDRDTHIGTDGEWGYGVRINNSSYITIRNVNVKKCWGDGFVISGNSYNVVLDNCISSNNRRQGCSISGGEYIYVNKGSYKNTNGTDPQAGIDIEPNTPADIIKNIFIDGVDFSGNTGSGLEINIQKLVEGVGTPDEVLIYINNCVFDGNCRGLTYVCSTNTPQLNTVKGLIRATNCTIENSTNSLCLYNIIEGTMPVFEAENIVIRGWTNYAIHTTTTMVGDTTTTEYGGFKLKNISLYEPPATLPSPATAILFNPTDSRKINAKIEDIYLDGLPQQQAVYWTRGNGNITFKKPETVTNIAYTYEFANGLPISYTTDTTFYLPRASYHKGKKYTVTHTGQSNAFRVGLANSSDTITGISEFIAGIANVLSIVGTTVTFKSDGINTWNAINKNGKIAPLDYSHDRRVVYGIVIPTAGTWTRGDRVVNYTSTVGQPKAWSCTVTGTPGTWVSEGNL